MPSRAYLSEEAQQEERDDRDRLRELDGKIQLLRQRRLALVGRVRELSGEQKYLFDARQQPQEKVEALHEEHRELGNAFARARSERDRARVHLDEVLARAREVRSEINPTERVRPDRVRKEIADLELRQQTHALPVDEENVLIARLRERTKFLHEIEARESVLAEHEVKRKEAEAAVQTAREAVRRLSEEMDRLRAARDAKMAEIRSTLVMAGGVVAQIREKAGARREVMKKLDALGRELEGLEVEARKILSASRHRQDEARAAARRYAPRRGAPGPAEGPAHADAKLEELLKRGKITLG